MKITLINKSDNKIMFYTPNFIELKVGVNELELTPQLLGYMLKEINDRLLDVEVVKDVENKDKTNSKRE